VNDQIGSERGEMAIILSRLADTLAMLRRALEGHARDEVEVWVDGDHVYLAVLLPELDEDSLDLSMQAGRLLVTAAR
jgi:HSP20 family molecular chaperone IbpA